MVEKCDICQTYKKQNQKELMIPHPVPERTWERVVVDLFYFRGNEYLLIVDYFSKYVEIALRGKHTSSGKVHHSVEVHICMSWHSCICSIQPIVNSLQAQNSKESVTISIVRI